MEKIRVMYRNLYNDKKEIVGYVFTAMVKVDFDFDKKKIVEQHLIDYIYSVWFKNRGINVLIKPLDYYSDENYDNPSIVVFTEIEELGMEEFSLDIPII